MGCEKAPDQWYSASRGNQHCNPAMAGLPMRILIYPAFLRNHLSLRIFEKPPRHPIFPRRSGQFSCPAFRFCVFRAVHRAGCKLALPSRLEVTLLPAEELFARTTLPALTRGLFDFGPGVAERYDAIENGGTQARITGIHAEIPQSLELESLTGLGYR